MACCVRALHAACYLAAGHPSLALPGQAMRVQNPLAQPAVRANPAGRGNPLPRCAMLAPVQVVAGTNYKLLFNVLCSDDKNMALLVAIANVPLPADNGGANETVTVR